MVPLADRQADALGADGAQRSQGLRSTQWSAAVSEVHPETYRAAVRFARFLLLFHGTVIVLSIVFQLW